MVRPYEGVCPSSTPISSLLTPTSKGVYNMLKDNLYAELLEDLHPNRPRVEILGDSRVIVENHCGIQEYDDSILRVRCRGCEVRILGANLELTALSMDELAVIGVISSVEYITTE